MVDVVAWPPVGLTAFEITKIDPISVSKSLINSKPFVSRFGRSRRVATSVVSGISYDAAGAGYMEMLKEYLDGGVNLIRLEVFSAIWHFKQANSNPLLFNTPIEWTAGGTQLVWACGSTDVAWYLKTFTATTRTGNALTVTGLPINTIIIRPHEIVSLWVNNVKEQRRASRLVMSNGSGVAVIYTKDAFTGIGPVVLGDSESVVFRVDGVMPRAVQPQSGEWTYDWSLQEAFADEYSAWVEVNPWE
jgi:hypothetical protein